MACILKCADPIQDRCLEKLEPAASCLYSSTAQRPETSLYLDRLASSRLRTFGDDRQYHRHCSNCTVLQVLQPHALFRLPVFFRKILANSNDTPDTLAPRMCASVGVHSEFRSTNARVQCRLASRLKHRFGPIESGLRADVHKP